MVREKGEPMGTDRFAHRRILTHQTRYLFGCGGVHSPVIGLPQAEVLATLIANRIMIFQEVTPAFII